MSKFLEIPKSALTPTCLHKEAQNYILEDLRPSLAPFGGPKDKRDGKEEELIQLSIDQSDNKLRMYGSAQELLENINIFKNFPANHRFFDTSVEPYQTRPRIFTSLKNEQYIAKSDLFVILQNMMTKVGTGKSFPRHLVALDSFLLKSREPELLEFVRFNEKVFDEMFQQLILEFNNHQSTVEEIDEILMEVSYLNTPAEVLEAIISPFIPVFYKDASKIKARVKMFLEEFQSELMKNPMDRLASYELNRMHVNVLEAFTDQRPNMFSPRRQGSQEPFTVRVFEDGDQRFVMKSEIFKTKPGKPYILETITMEELFKNHESHTQNVEFIRYPITRAKHRATPIQGLCGNFFILAIDFFFEYLRELILGKKVFQKLKPVDLPKFLDDLNRAYDMFCKTADIHFIKIGILLWLSVSHLRHIPARDVRNAKKDGFTVQNLKNELAHLGLTTTFPEIQDYAEAVYAEVDKHNKESVLRTCDLFDAVEHCQLICILERIPRLKKFVHNQKGCHRVYGLKCEDCATENPENEKDQKLTILEKELAELKIAHQKMLEENQQKSLEIQELQQKNLRLSVKNETDEVKMKQLTDKLAQSKLSIDDGNYSNAGTSNAAQLKIQCLICEKSIESEEDQIIRCPLCQRRFHSKCAVNWLKEHKECPACNGEPPKR